MSALTIIFLFYLLLLCHCQVTPGSWSTTRANNQRNGVVRADAKSLEKLSTPPTKLKWSVQTAPDSMACEVCSDHYDPAPIFYSPGGGNEDIVIAGHGVRFGSDNSFLVARSAVDGKLIYNVTLNGWYDSATTAGTVLTDGSVVTTHRSGVVYITKEGKVKWTYKLSDELSVPTVTKSGLVIVNRALCGGLFALEISSGIKKWETSFEGQGFCSDAYLSQDEKTLWVTTTTTFNYTAFWWSVDAETGKAQNRGQFPDIGNPEIGFERGNTISTDDGTLYMSYDEGDASCWPYCPPNPQIFQINSNDGKQQPVLHLDPEFVGPIGDISISTFGGVLYISNDTGALMAIDPSVENLGKVLWKEQCVCTGKCQTMPNFFDEPYLSYFPPIIVVSTESSEGVILSGVGNQLCVRDLGSGKLLWQYGLPTYIFQQPAVSPFGDIFVSTLTLNHGSWLLAL